jgi:hypothetical protein
MTLTKSDYKAYIISPEWRNKHKSWLQRSKYRCAFSGLTIGRTIKGKYFGYAVHHMNYNNLGDETLWDDVICLHPLVHRLIVHGILSGFKRPSQQDHYPNKAQQAFHYWCTLPHLVRVALVVVIAVNVVKVLF